MPVVAKQIKTVKIMRESKLNYGVCCYEEERECSHCAIVEVLFDDDTVREVGFECMDPAVAREEMVKSWSGSKLQISLRPDLPVVAVSYLKLPDGTPLCAYDGGNPEDGAGPLTMVEQLYLTGKDRFAPMCKFCIENICEIVV